MENKTKIIKKENLPTILEEKQQITRLKMHYVAKLNSITYERCG